MLAELNPSDCNIQELAKVRNLLPIRHFDDAEFAGVILTASFHSIAPGQTLFRSASDDAWMYYLLDGAIRIFDIDNEPFDLDGSTIETLYPLTTHPKVRVRAESITAARYVRFPREVIEAATQGPKAGIEIREISEQDESVEPQVLFAVYHAVLAGDVIIPSLPDVATKIQAAVNDPESDVELIAKIIQTDPATSAYCLNIANSAAYNSASEAAEIREAVIRIGINATRDLVVAYTLKSLFQSEAPAAHKRMRESWQHSCRIAAFELCHRARIDQAQSRASDVGRTAARNRYHGTHRNGKKQR